MTIAIDGAWLRLDHRQALEPLTLAVEGPLREAAMRTWQGRMVNETQSSLVFEALAAQLASAGFEADVAAECASFADEERRHGALCGSVVAALGGEACARIPRPRTLPAHSDTTARAAALRNAISVGCLSETVAVALIGAERLEMPEGELRSLLTRIYADEVGHARFGWSLVARVAPQLDDAERRAVDAYLPVAFGHLEAHELAHLPASSVPPDGGAALGVCSGADGRVLFFETVESVIVPQLEAHGFSARSAWAARRS